MNTGRSTCCPNNYYVIIYKQTILILFQPIALWLKLGIRIYIPVIKQKKKAIHKNVSQGIIKSESLNHSTTFEFKLLKGKLFLKNYSTILFALSNRLIIYYLKSLNIRQFKIIPFWLVSSRIFCILDTPWSWWIPFLPPTKAIRK